MSIDRVHYNKIKCLCIIFHKDKVYNDKPMYYNGLVDFIIFKGHRTKLISIQEDNNIFLKNQCAFLFENVSKFLIINCKSSDNTQKITDFFKLILTFMNSYFYKCTIKYNVQWNEPISYNYTNFLIQYYVKHF